MSDARAIAYDVLDRVTFDGAYSHIALSNALDDADLDDRDRGLATELVYGVLARQRTLDTLLGRFVDRPLDDLDRPVVLSLRLAAYQLLFLDRIPDHAAVDEAVELTKRHCGGGAAGFTNGVLRSMLRNRDDWPIWETVDPDDDPARHLGIRHSLPDWLAARLIEAHGFDEAMRRAASFNDRPPLYFRRLDDSTEAPDDLTPVDTVPGAYRADSMGPEVSDAVDDRRLVVQDLGSQLVGHFATPNAADSILDACAGLGGKTLLAATLAGTDAAITAVEPNRSKLDRLEASVAEANFSDRIETFHGELGELPDDAGLFELVVVDAPCSGLGVIRRHPETRWRRSPDDVADRARLQSELLAQAADRTAPNGLLVYAVCTFTDEEGPGVVDAFLKDHPEFERESPSGGDIDWTNFVDERGDLRVNPADHDADAFYAARIRRIPD